MMRRDIFLKSDRFYLCDGGLETYMIFDKGFDLPCFSAAVLLESDEGQAALRDYYARFVGLAAAHGRGFVMDAPTWRAGAAWSGPLGQSLSETMQTNARAVAFVQALRAELETGALPILVNGLVGPAGDAYAPDTVLSAEEARMIHLPQIAALAEAGVDMISAMTLTHAEEATGIALAAQELGVPCAIAFTLETDGHLPSGQPLEAAIAQVDAATGAAPVYYMINCAHPDHFDHILTPGAAWLERIGGVRANASRMSHAELDAAEELDAGDPSELGALYAALATRLPHLRVLGGCCGTDHRHVGCIAAHTAPKAAA